jgi:hypothetical protein
MTAKKAVAHLRNSGVAEGTQPSYDCNTFGPVVGSGEFFVQGRQDSASQRELVKRPAMTAAAAHPKFGTEGRWDRSFVDALEARCPN